MPVTPPLVDTHCHLAFSAFDADREEVVERARQAGLVACVAVAVDAPSARAALDLSGRLPGWAHATAGLHPTEAVTADPEAWPEIAELLASRRFVAVGETGLDAHHRTVPMEAQVASLHRHLRAALDLDLPVVLHCREAFERLSAELGAYAGAPLRGVLHCYTGTLRELPGLLEAGLHVGLGGIATYPASRALREAAAAVPADRLLLETDAPWLAPQPVRGRRNEPAYVAHVAERLAAERGCSLEGLARLTTANAHALFGLDAAGGGGA